MKVQLSELNKRLLTNLASSSGNVLENKELLQSLDSTKAAAVGVSEALSASKAVQLELDQQRDAYLAVAVHAASIFFVLVDLQAVNHMYRFSLSTFLALFRSALKTSAPSQDVTLRIAAINPVCCFTCCRLRNCVPCLFERLLDVLLPPLLRTQPCPCLLESPRCRQRQARRVRLGSSVHKRMSAQISIAKVATHTAAAVCVVRVDVGGGGHGGVCDHILSL